MKALDTKFVKLIFAVLIILFVMWLMSVLKCEMAPPAY
jgi:flagellar biogenesis protein FliO